MQKRNDLATCVEICGRRSYGAQGTQAHALKEIAVSDPKNKSAANRGGVSSVPTTLADDGEIWPSLPFVEWKDTYETLQR
jgi:hypothetical protein